MRIGLCVDSVSPQLTGIGRYCWELAQLLPQHPDIQSVRYFVGTRIIDHPSILLGASQSSGRGHWAKRIKAAFDRIGAGRRRLDLVHGPNYMLPDWAEQGVVTVHDLSVFKYPETHPPDRLAAFDAQFQRTLERAVHLITDCETVRREVIEFTGFPANRVTSVPLGVSPRFRPIPVEERAAFQRRCGLPPGGYGLTISTLEPRKRIDCLISAWRELPRSLRECYPLVVAGATGWRNEALHAEMDRAAAEGWLIRCGFIPDDDLPALYSGASLFIFPSMYEGFGLPPIEAMASGVPTIVADNGTLAEVTRGAARLVEPEDIKGFASAIQEGLEHRAWRERAISAGVQVASEYTWAKCVDRTAEVYRRALSQSEV